MNSRSEMSTVASQTMRDFGSSSNTKNIFSRVDKSSNGLMVDPLQRTSNSFFKRNFFEKRKRENHVSLLAVHHTSCPLYAVA